MRVVEGREQHAVFYREKLLTEPPRVSHQGALLKQGQREAERRVSCFMCWGVFLHADTSNHPDVISSTFEEITPKQVSFLAEIVYHHITSAVGFSLNELEKEQNMFLWILPTTKWWLVLSVCSRILLFSLKRYVLVEVDWLIGWPTNRADFVAFWRNRRWLMAANMKPTGKINKQDQRLLEFANLCLFKEHAE